MGSDDDKYYMQEFCLEWNEAYKCLLNNKLEVLVSF